MLCPHHVCPPHLPMLCPHAALRCQIHWFSIINSFMMVMFLTGLVSIILMRTLRRDYQRYAKTDDLESLEQDLNEESGWKLVSAGGGRGEGGGAVWTYQVRHAPPGCQ